MATPNLMVVEMLDIELLPMTKWLIDPPRPEGGWWKPDPDRPGNGIELDPRAVKKYAID
jgi:L-alanine-DL-glutamate epimerase-like enolase superfamily enzyme